MIENFPNIWSQHLTGAYNTQLTRGIFRDSPDFLWLLIKIMTFRHSQGAQTNFLEKEIIFCHPEGPQPTLRTSYCVSIESRDLEPFHSIEKYRVSNPQYRVS